MKFKVKKEEKFCPSCKLVVQISFFGKNKHTRDGVADWCIPCTRLKQKKMRDRWGKNQRQRKREQLKLWKERRRDRVAIHRKRYTENNCEKIRDRKMKSMYGIGIEERDSMSKSQNNSCAICKIDFTKMNKRANVDHCHVTGKIRGLLCSRCNTGIGQFKDSVSLLESAIEYLKRY